MGLLVFIQKAQGLWERVELAFRLAIQTSSELSAPVPALLARWLSHGTGQARIMHPLDAGIRYSNAENLPNQEAKCLQEANCVRMLDRRSPGIGSIFQVCLYLHSRAKNLTRVSYALKLNYTRISGSPTFSGY